MSCLSISEGENEDTAKWERRPFVSPLAKINGLGGNEARARCHRSADTERMRKEGGGVGGEVREKESQTRKEQLKKRLVGIG